MNEFVFSISKKSLTVLNCLKGELSAENARKILGGSFEIEYEKMVKRLKKYHLFSDGQKILVRKENVWKRRIR